ncbi:acyl-CoA N-acyltransferase [Mycena epipterygia]|nr:acyl-CoA N-acyltransferase [Mycena epipterygia]
MPDAILVPTISPELKAECIAIRRTVFAQEQGYVHLDTNQYTASEDAVSLHFLLADSANPDAKFMGTARLSAHPEHTYVLSRFALLPSCRGNGNGAKLITALEQWVLTQEGFHFMKLEAQVGSAGFYEKMGCMSQSSETYILEGTPDWLAKKDLCHEEAPPYVGTDLAC